MTKQVLAGGKGAESDGEPCDVNGRHQEGYSVCRETSCSRATPEQKAGLPGHLRVHGIGRLAISTISSLLVCLHPLLHNVPCIKHRFGEPECEQLEV